MAPNPQSGAALGRVNALDTPPDTRERRIVADDASTMEDWAVELQRDRPREAWDLFIGRYRRLVFTAIRYYARDYDDVMDVFAWVCEALQADDFRRLRAYAAQDVRRARFSTWLVTVVRHLTVDWFRRQSGRRRLSTVAEGMSPLRRRIFELVFLEHRAHVEAYETLRSNEMPELDFREFLGELRATYRAATAGRRGQILREIGTPPWPEEDSVEVSDDSAERREILAGALENLPAEDRLAVILYVREQLPAEQVAKILNLANAKAVYNRVYRAMAVLRADLERAGIGPQDL
jgi:RNA polymerase sigma factor (sigma-70 family)